MSLVRSALLRASRSEWLADQALKSPISRRAVLKFMPGEDLGSALTAKLARLVLWGGALPPDLPLETARAAWAGAAIELVSGGDDEHAPPAGNEADCARLAELGVASTVHRFPGGHRLDAALLARLIG